MGKKLQFVWPKDGHKGRTDRGCLSGLGDIMTGKGPDMFIQKKGSRTAIRPDHWGNWQVAIAHQRESNYEKGLFGTSRGFQRYDPASRRYAKWNIPHDWSGLQIDPVTNQPFYPRFTEGEEKRMLQRIRHGKLIDPRKMGSQWTTDGPKRFQQQYDGFWQEAHRIGENLREGFPALWEEINPYLRMHQEWPDDLQQWI